MAEEQDDFEDPKLSDLLRRWGREVHRTERPPEGQDPPAGLKLFQLPADLSRLHRALDEVDKELARRGGGRTRVLSPRWLPWFLAVAASLILAVGLWQLFLRQAGSAPVVSSLLLSVHEAPLRGEGETIFHSGQQVYLRFRVDRTGDAFVAMLDSGMRFGPVSKAVRRVVKGENLLGPFRLDDNSGKESFVLLFSGRALTLEEFQALVARASARDLAITHEEYLAAVVADLRSRPGIAVEAVTFEHLK